MTLAVLFLGAAAVVFLVASLIRGRVFAALGVMATVLLSLSLVQGDESPLAILKSTAVTLLAVGMLLVSAFASHVVAPNRLRRNGVVRWGLSALILCLLVSGVISVTAGRQWSVLVTYSMLLLLPFLFSHNFRLVPMAGLVLGGMYQLAVALLGGYYVPTLSGVPQLSAGVQPNILALQAGLVSIFGLHLSLQKSVSLRVRVTGCFVFFVAFTGIVLTVSRSGMISAIVSISVLILLSVRSRVLLVAVLMVVPFLSAAIVGGVSLPWIEQWFVRGDAKSMSSLTGRTDIWNLAFNMVGEKPIFGWGFGALYRDDFSGGIFLRLVEGTNAHNAWLQIAVECGIVGVICLFVVFAATWLLLWRRRSSGEARVHIAVLSFLTINSLVSASFATVGVAAMIFAAIMAVASWYSRPVPVMVASPTSEHVDSFSPRVSA